MTSNGILPTVGFLNTEGDHVMTFLSELHFDVSSPARHVRVCEIYGKSEAVLKAKSSVRFSGLRQFFSKSSLGTLLPMLPRGSVRCYLGASS